MEDGAMQELGAEGGRARAMALSKAERSRIAKEAAEARWHSDVPQAVNQGELKISDVVIPCAVIEEVPGDSTTAIRVLTQRGVLVALGRHKNPTKGQTSIDDKPAFLAANNLNRFIPEELKRSWTPLKFRMRGVAGGYQGNIAFGYRAEIIPQVCRVFLDADAEGELLPSQKHIAFRARMLLSGLGTVGIFALVDEATGYQDDRARDALAKILEQFVAKELRRWVKTFPLDYFRELCRLRHVTFSDNMQLPQYFGHLTNDIVYSRLAPGVLAEIKKKNPSVNGRRKDRNHQWLTDSMGHPKLLGLLGSVVTLMKINAEYEPFHEMLDKIHPIYRDMPLFKGMEDD